MPVTLLPVGLLSRPALRLFLGLARLLLALALLLQLLMGLQVLLGRLSQRLGGLVHPLVDHAGELRERLVHRPAHLLEILGRHAGNGAARRPDRPRTGARRIRRRTRTPRTPLRIPVVAVPLGAPLLFLEIFGHLVDVLGAGLLRPGLLRCALRPGLPRRTVGSPPAVVRSSTARSRTLRIHLTTPNAPAQSPNRIAHLLFPRHLTTPPRPPPHPHGMRTTFKFPKHEERPTGNNIRTPAAACGTRYIPKRPSRLTNKGGVLHEISSYKRYQEAIALIGYCYSIYYCQNAASQTSRDAYNSRSRAETTSVGDKQLVSSPYS